VSDAADLLERAAAHVRWLRPDWRDAGRFDEERSEALGLLAAARAVRCGACAGRASDPEPRARRLAALLADAWRVAAARAAEAETLRRLAAAAVRPRRARRRVADGRQGVLPLAGDGVRRARVG
jgi:hypothetical protein